MFSYLIKYPISIKYCLCILFLKTLICVFLSGNKNKGKGNGAGLAWECQSHWFADEFLITHAHSFGTDTQHEYSQENCRTMSSIIIKLE